MAQLLTYVVCWDYKFRATNWRGKVEYEHGRKAYTERAQALTDAARDGYHHLQTWANTLAPLAGPEIVNPTEPLVVFAAPEWVMTRGGHADSIDETYFHRDDRDAYRTLCSTLSDPAAKPFPGQHTLVVAGSMLWVEERTGQGLSEMAERTLHYVKAARGQVPEAARGAFDVQARLLEGDTGPERTHVAYNEAFIAYDGAIMASILKSEYGVDFPGHENRMTLMPGLGAGTADVLLAGRTLKVGVGICIDAKRLRAYGEAVNLYILISQTISVDLVPEGTVLPGGLTVYADGTDTATVLPAPPAKNPLEKENLSGFVVARTLITLP